MRRYSGPAPPKSWASKFAPASLYETTTWRAQALSLIAVHLPRFTRHHFAFLYDDTSSVLLPLTMLCLCKAFALCTFREFAEEVVPYIPSHLKRELIRYHAIRAPLSDAYLRALRGSSSDECSVDGELLIIGPQSTLEEDFFTHSTSPTQARSESWDIEVDDSSRILHTFILVHSPLSTSTLLSLPPSITHLALIHVPQMLPIHRLPVALPLLQLLDLSYNDWLAKDEESSAFVLQRVDWRRWRGLQVLGLRGCCIPQALEKKVNLGRWDDVLIVV